MNRTQVPRSGSGDGQSPDVQSSTTTFEVHRCEVSVRGLQGPCAQELFFHCQPTAELAQAHEQAEAIYMALQQVLAELGASFAAIVSETVFHRRIDSTIEIARTARSEVIAQAQDAVTSVLTEIEQPPLDQHVWLEIQAHAILPTGNTSRAVIKRPRTCPCVECRRARGVVLTVGHQSKFHSGALYGKGDNAYEQTHDMFAAADLMLQEAGMEFKDVVRTWIYLSEMERDYPMLNQARREFFTSRGISPPPASTGIGSGLVPKQHSLCLGVVAIKGGERIERTLMTTPTLNEAPQYGADFSRGMRINENNGDVLYVSGTASLNENGQSVHDGDFEAQVQRMLVNVKTLLSVQDANFGHIVSAVTYVKHLDNAVRLRRLLSDAGYSGFPHALVVAPVCRPELLCETEALAMIEAPR